MADGGGYFAGDLKVAGTITAAATSAASARWTAPPVPATAAAAGTTGDIAWDTGFIYVCTATNTWKRVAIATW